MTVFMCLIHSSSDKCEAVGHRPAMFSDDHDENRSHQAHGVYGVSEKVSMWSRLPHSDGRMASIKL